MAMNRKLAVEHSLEVESPVTTTLAILLVLRGSTVDSTRPTERPWGVEVDCLLPRQGRAASSR
jgi:hypothetical protein